jgi:hypothetical protein
MFNPFFLWADIALKTTEMMVASGQVITHRVDRIARAGANPSARDRKEFTLMGTEKAKAAGDAAFAVGMQAWQQWFTACMGMALPATARGRKRAMSRASTNAARLTQAAIGPYHRASRANAKRLARL